MSMYILLYIYIYIYIYYIILEQQKCLKSSPAQDSDEVELQANPSYATVGPARIQ